MVTSQDRELLWQRLHELVVATAAELEKAPVREAIDEIERRGLSLDVLARVVQQRLGEQIDPPLMSAAWVVAAV